MNVRSFLTSITMKKKFPDADLDTMWIFGVKSITQYFINGKHSNYVFEVFGFHFVVNMIIFNCKTLKPNNH